MSTIARCITFLFLAVMLAVTQIQPSTAHTGTTNNAYIDCSSSHSYFSQDLVLVNSSTTNTLYRASDTGWLSSTTPISWTQLRATPDKTIFVYNEPHGLFRGSLDLGTTWPLSDTFPLASPYVATQFYPAPISGTLFMGLNDYSIQVPGIRGVYKSTDNGAHWTNTGGVTGSDIAFSPDFAADGIAFESYVIYHATGLNITTNGGDSWTPADSGLSPSFQGMPYHLAISPNFPNDQTLFAAADTGLYKTSNAGSSWSKLRSGDWFSSTSYYASLSPNYAIDQSVLLVNREQQLELSQNGGSTWQPISLPISTTAQVAALRVSAPFEPPPPAPPPAMPYHFYLPLISAARIQPLEIWLIANEGIGCKLYRSSNLGATWQEEIVTEMKR
jgi:hypothetical protein